MASTTTSGTYGSGLIVVAAAGLAALLALVVAVGLAPGGIRPAAAGGVDPLTPARDRYEPGQTVTMIGYTDLANEGWRAAGPYHAWLRVDPAAAEADMASGATRVVHPTDVRMAPVTVKDLPPPGDVRNQRASVTFELPAELTPGHYQLALCNDPCTAGLEPLWPDTLHVGVDPDVPVVRRWPLTEPAIRWLEDDALLAVPGGADVTAADVRAGRVPAVTSGMPAPGSGPASPSGAPVLPATSARTGSAASDADAGEGRSGDGTATSPTEPGEAGVPASGDGGALAWWIATSVVVLLAGVAAVAAVTARRRRSGGRPPLDPVVVTAGPGPGPRPAATSTRPRSRSVRSARSVGSAGLAGPAGPLPAEGACDADQRHARPVRVRL
jgi:hypothetical protein